MKSKVLVIGGANIDYVGRSFSKLVKEDSNPGTVTWSFGGVARNIVENLAYLSAAPTFITAISPYDLGSEMIKHLEKLDVVLEMPALPKRCSTNSYLAILDETGEMQAGLADTTIISYLDVDYMKRLDNLIDSFEYIVFDTNLNTETIAYLCDAYQHKKLIVDGISTTKVRKLRAHLHQIYLIKCNYLEACELSGHTDNEEILQFFKQSGVQKAIITHGAKALWYLDNGHFKKTLIPPVDKIINVTGAGDALLAGVVARLIENDSLAAAVTFGIKVSQLTLKTSLTVNPDVSKLL